ncbi:MAG: CRISPR-associated protein Cas4 [Chloroflexi bacterium]|nr:CRISPR-associated protein Cas4 [Chloroflexota bacterium]
MLETDNLLPLSGIQHFLFCRRQWALIEIERVWQDNFLTIEGTQLHQKVDDPFFTEVRSGVITARSVPIRSSALGLIGVCDLVEFTPSPNGIYLPGRSVAYTPMIVEYKRGQPKKGAFDEAQLCAQAMCLEEMLSTTIVSSCLYYGEIRRRESISFTQELRSLVQQASLEMHQYFKRQYIPKVKPHQGCSACSINSVCLPKIQGNNRKVSDFITSCLSMGDE